jgi:hypothetical protein
MVTVEVLQEITQWTDTTPNHTYWVLASGKLWAYQPVGTDTPVVLKNPMTFDRSRRRFNLIRTEPDPAKTAEPSVVVQGSGGKTYTVTLGDNPACTCAGFRFRGACKHLEQASAKS